MSINSICESIAQPSPIFVPSIIVTKWRDENSQVVRKIAAGPAMAGSALLSLIDTVGSLALGILSAPLMLGGVNFTVAFLRRAALNCMIAGLFLSFAQYYNLTAEKVGDAIDKRFS